MLKELNHSFIVLIPKNENPSNFNHFRPISLCNTMYKVISKLLVARLRPLLHKFISPLHSAFIPGRWIIENIVMVQELLHSFKTRKLKVGMFGVKADLSKAYDRVNWKFLISILNQLGFHPKFINWIEKCMATVSYTLIINGCKVGAINPSKGLRQGNPLSPYLFIICQEILSRIINRAVQRGELSWVRANRTGLVFTHLMHADDVVLFSRAKMTEIKAMEQWVNLYCSWSGQ
jgi:hypothetical protein